MSDFKTAMGIIFSHEGGYVNDPRDPGGETRYGISKRAYPNIDIRELKREDAAKIYKRDYWDKVRGDSLPFGVALAVFDFAVNAGVDRSIKLLQRCVDVKQDGKFGDVTLAAVLAHNKHALMEELATGRIMYYSGLATFKTYGAGWTRRTVETLATGLLYREN